MQTQAAAETLRKPQVTLQEVQVKKLAKWIFILVIIGAVGLIGNRVYQKVQEKDKPVEARRATVVAVEVVSPEKKTLDDVGFFTGTLAADSRFIVSPRIAGRLDKLLVNIGDKIKKGQQIAQLDDREYVQQAVRAKEEVEVAKANLNEYKTQLDITTRDFERAKELRAKNITSEAALDQAKSALNVQTSRVKVAEANLNLKEAALKESELRLSYTKVNAEWEDGTELRYIGEKFVDEGALLTVNGSIVTVIDISTLTGVITVVERDYAKIVPGQSTAITTDAFPGKKFEGKIMRVAPQLQESSRQARVEMQIQNPEGLLKPGMFIRVEIVFGQYKDVTTIPIVALVHRDNKEGVFVIDGDKAKFVEVEKGFEAGGAVEIKSALSGQVVVTGQHLLQDGTAIKIYTEEPAEKTTPEKVGGEKGKRN